MSDINIKVIRGEMQQVLEDNILRYWLTKVLDERGGFYGRVDGNDCVHADAERGAIMYARILWAFSAAYRVLKKEEYLRGARQALDYIQQHFIDKEQGGVFWSLNADGSVRDGKKQIYAIGFAIYGLSEYVRATGDEAALRQAIALYDAIESHAFDAEHVGYVEALTQSWQSIDDMRLSEKDENASRTMNTHLHIIEPYTNLYRVWPSPRLEKSLRTLLNIFLDKIFNKESHHLDLFFNDRWEGRRNIQSFGHDIEASWLLHETALVLGDATLLARIEPVVQQIADAAAEGLQADGSMVYEKWTDTGHVDMQRQWWVMCETVIGYLNIYQHFGSNEALQKAARCWAYTKSYLIDKVNGEWFWSIDGEGRVNTIDDKAGFWKCPYHNSRMCLEVMERFG